MTVYHFFCFTSAEVFLKTILVLTSVEETLSQIKVVKVASFRQANVSAFQSTNSAKTTFFSLSLITLQRSLWNQFLTINSLNVCRLITVLTDQLKNKPALLTPLFHRCKYLHHSAESELLFFS